MDRCGALNIPLEMKIAKEILQCRPQQALKRLDLQSREPQSIGFLLRHRWFHFRAVPLGSCSVR
jgi:hypothetical protein